MNSSSRSYYRRFYRLVAVAVAVLTGVLTGSLVLGDSVRGSLAERVNERLGDAETLIQTGTDFLSDSILRADLLASAKGYLMAEGFVSVGGQMVPVTVWGTDGDSLRQGEALVNEELYNSAISQSNHSAVAQCAEHSTPIVVHLSSNNLVSSGSLFVTQSYSTQLRLQVKGVKMGNDGGNTLLRNEQVRPQNVFVNRRQLSEALGVAGKVNVILSPDHITADAFRGVWLPSHSGLKLSSDSFLEKKTLVVGTDRVFLSQAVVDSLRPSARYLAYFVNSIVRQSGGQPGTLAVDLPCIPYSFVTATDQLHGDETVLSDYAARRLNAGVGDSVTMEYFVSSGGLKQLKTRRHRFRVSSIVSLEEFQQQAELLTADFPGLSGVQRCTDWDSDLPIDMSRITRADEDYWAEYRQTPKALVSLDAVGGDWVGPYGSATKVVLSEHSKMFPALTSHSLGRDGLGALTAPLYRVVHPRAAALRAARHGTDFGMLFLALGFFIIVAAILLMRTPLSEMYHLRRQELQLLATVGYSCRRIFRRLFAEALPVVLVAAPIGVLLGYGYAAVVLWLLAGPWSGATHTDGFAVHAAPLTVILSLVVAIGLVLVVLCLSVRSAVKTYCSLAPRNSHLELSSYLLPRIPDVPSPTRSLSSFFEPPSLLAPPSYLVMSLRYYRRQHRLSFWTLALGVLTVFAVGLNRPDFNHSSMKATGGFEYYGESRIPMQYDLNSAAGRRHLHLGDLPADVRFLQLSKHTEDEASCLNLNKVETPSVLGMPTADMVSFGIDTLLLDSFLETATVFIDEEALLWSMMRQVGDTLTYHASDGSEVQAVIAGTYPTGVLHGNAIMPMKQFRKLWPDETGSRVILANSQLSTLNSQLNTALSDYGLTMTTTRDRLRMFFEVTDTYLRIFLTLGGLGVLLGLFSLLIVIRKNMTARTSEIRLYLTLGFPHAKVVGMLRCEQSVVPLLAIVAGTLGALLVSFLLELSSLLIPRIPDVPSPTRSLSSFPEIITAIVLFVLMVVLTLIIIHTIINNKTIRQCET